ncbi:Septum site-determining protein MinC [Tepidimonas sediminis]|uniref:Probable septum site-determining protein MinC n=1 Tax=Tepidimonas sediminis TaxID=2588941 RepID=A0A554WQK3_9BURK|nr:septum site-determining protein MinC [Tepidimonas sediminis]TSE25847.1 Septum site-determining protein MinC [Tepidimonas sediminis]
MHRSNATDTPLEIRPTDWSVLCARLRGGRLEAVLAELEQRYGRSGFFEGEPLVLDLAQWPAEHDPTALEVEALLRALRGIGLQPVGYTGASAGWTEALRGRGLLPATDVAPSGARAAASPVSVAPAPPPAPASALVVERPLRSGQQVYARGRDLVVLAMVNPGAEVIADGHVHVYAPLRGRALAGARGDAQARVFALAFEAELVSVAGVYQTAEHGWPDAVRGRATQVRLVHAEGRETLRLEPLN